MLCANSTCQFCVSGAIPTTRMMRTLKTYPGMYGRSKPMLGVTGNNPISITRRYQKPDKSITPRAKKPIFCPSLSLALPTNSPPASVAISVGKPDSLKMHFKSIFVSFASLDFKARFYIKPSIISKNATNSLISGLKTKKYGCLSIGMFKSGCVKLVHKTRYAITRDVITR
jgi:hypothetical protein